MERRRSQRVMIRVGVTLFLKIAGQTVNVNAVTVSVNDYGAMLSCSRRIDPGTTFELQNDRTRQRVPCKVTRAPHETPEGYLVPIEFASPQAAFWHISFPPTDWKSPES